MTRRSLFAAVAGVFGAKAVPTTIRDGVYCSTVKAIDLNASTVVFSGVPVYVSSHAPHNAVTIFNLKVPK